VVPRLIVDKRAALVDLGRHLGLFDTKHKQPDAPVQQLKASAARI
jgi:hypothetical protein